ncbi:hypothetical protein GOBAR_AA02506 [Gossypium barbadense]|uniref:Uncharacterized protein n=1 Tax=Gossypium barbadense TaxID=3634 RepID=A0A2P5YR60_GOSBA|nr:hypothetical protein GOBAR_AA02506 [Gossypium barbadense]
MSSQQGSSDYVYGIGQITKKVCCWEKDPSDGGMVAIKDNIAGSMNFKVTFFYSKLDEEEEDLKKDDFELIDDDVMTQMVDSVPDIQFSDKLLRSIRTQIIVTEDALRARPLVLIFRDPPIGEDTDAQSVVDPREQRLVAHGWLCLETIGVHSRNKWRKGNIRTRLGPRRVLMAINGGIEGALIVAQAKGPIPKPMGNKEKAMALVSLAFMKV